MVGCLLDRGYSSRYTRPVKIPYLPLLLLLPALAWADDDVPAAPAEPTEAAAAQQTAGPQEAHFPWEKDMPQELVETAVLPDRVIHETPCNWRPVLTPLVRSMVKDCNTAREAVLTLAKGLKDATGVHYSTERRTHCMNAIEALTEQKVSCTGQSIFLACALRAVGIPARVVGISTWNHIQGNHTWTEAWFDGEWHMIEYNEADFNTPWVMENIGMLNPSVVMQHIQAAMPGGDDIYLSAYLMDHALLQGEDVTERYLALSREWYAKGGLPTNQQRIMLDISPRPTEAIPVSIQTEDGQEISADALPTKTDDIRKLARLILPREGKHLLCIGDKSFPLPPTDAPVQVLHLQAGPEDK